MANQPNPASTHSWPSYVAFALVVMAATMGLKSTPLPQSPHLPQSPSAAAAIASRGGWWRVLKRTFEEILSDRLLAVAAGVTFYGLLAIFPAVTAFVSIYGLFADRQTVMEHIATLNGFLPEGTVTIIADQMKRIAGGPETGLGLAAVFGFGLALWSANAGTKAMIEALNIAYDVEEKRSFIRLTLHSLLFTAGGLATVLVLMGAVALIPVILQVFLVNAAADWLLWAGRWPLVLAILILGLAVLYRYAPDRPKVKWRWITPGSAVASVALLVFSMLFSWYAANLGSYNETYGSLGTAVIFLTWLWLSSTIVIAGAELNAEVERAATGTTEVAGEKKDDPA